MHGHWFISLGQQEHAFLGNVLHTYKYLGSFTSLPTFAWCPSGFSLRDSA